MRGDFLTLDDAAWHDGFALKFFGAMRLCRVAWLALRAAQGAIVNVVGIGAAPAVPSSRSAAQSTPRC